MHKIIDSEGSVYFEQPYENEAEYERMIVSNSDKIFGSTGIYFDIKKKIGRSNKGAAIPDGYYLDLMFHDKPTLYFVEIELSDHDVYGHIGEQILRFAISSETSRHKIQTILINEINSDPKKLRKLKEFFRESRYSNVHELINKLIFEDEISVIIVIDRHTPELEHVLSKIKIPADILEVHSYRCGNRILHRFSPLQDEIEEGQPAGTDYDELNTIVVPAREEGFKEEFLLNNRWYAVRIKSNMIEKLKYIAAYRVAPISAVTHIAEIESIDKYKDTDKYMLKFKPGTVREIKPIGKPGSAPQSPRYTSNNRLLSAGALSDVWKSK